MGNTVLLPNSNFICNGSTKQDAAPVRFSSAPEIIKTNEVVGASPVHAFPSTSSVRQQKPEEPTKDGNGKDKQSHVVASERKFEWKTTGKSNTDEETKKVTINSSRPSNPFAKSSSNQDSSSLLDSLKKMKKVEVKDK